MHTGILSLDFWRKPHTARMRQTWRTYVIDSHICVQRSMHVVQSDHCLTIPLCWGMFCGDFCYWCLVKKTHGIERGQRYRAITAFLRYSEFLMYYPYAILASSEKASNAFSWLPSRSPKRGHKSSNEVFILPVSILTHQSILIHLSINFRVFKA